MLDTRDAVTSRVYLTQFHTLEKSQCVKHERLMGEFVQTLFRAGARESLGMRLLAWAVLHFRVDYTHAQLSSVYLPSTARAGDVISEPRLELPPVPS